MCGSVTMASDVYTGEPWFFYGSHVECGSCGVFFAFSGVDAKSRTLEIVRRHLANAAHPHT